MPARVVVFGGDSASCISTELNTVGTLFPASPYSPSFCWSRGLIGRTQSVGSSHIPSSQADTAS